MKNLKFAKSELVIPILHFGKKRGTLPTMKERTLAILSALIEDFVETATPVASKHLLEVRNFDVSSATVRNEFALLEEIGLIRSPHISAGKIPTEKGYRFFVDELMKNAEAEEKFVQSIFEKHIAQYQFEKAREKVFDAVRLVAQLSGNVAFATINRDRTFYVGLSNVLRAPEFFSQPEKAARIVEILEGRENFQIILKNLNLPENQTKIFIGQENLIEEVQSCALVVSKFETENILGFIGILGPMRMRYGFNRALIHNVLEML
ncbi:hypothetical protein HN954_01490 [bacterium]|mgnify:CR=1 FL=1|jgi:heat-inducible transcriptional repressor|nr:hypothetical protein [bacterium]MBT6832411.1 hypothetical protein [bacterium]MBT6996082.1 hypothetical protein [bacterium]MBT7772531.1 hypothetical protein [bacterium]